VLRRCGSPSAPRSPVNANERKDFSVTDVDLRTLRDDALLALEARAIKSSCLEGLIPSVGVFGQLDDPVDHPLERFAAQVTVASNGDVERLLAVMTCTVTVLPLKATGMSKLTLVGEAAVGARTLSDPALLLL
jgi:hypothetical protein